MPNASQSLPFGRLACAGLLLLVSASGCSHEEEIRSYRVRRHEPDRILGAVVERPNDLWFFKIAGPAEVVDPKVDEARAFLRTVHFAKEDGPPEWTLPPGWTQKPGDTMRYATIEIPTGSKPLEMTVSTLARPPAPTDGSAPRDFGLENLNRWRNQLILPGMSRWQIADKTEPLKIEGALGYLAHWSGTQRAARPGMNAAMTAGHPKTSPPPRPEAPAQPSRNDIQYKLPEGWKEAPNDPVSLRAFEIADGEQNARVTISKLGPGAGGLAANVNRWRGQLGLAPLAADELDKASETIAVGPLEGRFVVIQAAEGAERTESILGVVVSDPAATWFIKLRGDAALAQREQERFKAFVGSLNFGRGDKAGPSGGADGD